MPGKLVGKNVRIERRYPVDLQSYFVGNVVAQHQPDSFILSFFEIWPPAIVGETDEEKQKMLDAFGYIEAKCVARLVLTPNRMRELVQVVTQNLQDYDNMMKELPSKLYDGG